ncbi:MAG: sigma-70 family RNA polymerase sigma factor [Saprospiraceae bacterium]|nr:sigma-70 family RNA polymerase sigma factor [Saprospiraceae bacterium]
MQKSVKERFLRMINENQGLINSICRVYGNETNFEDLRQDVLLQLWRAYPKFRAESTAKTWIYRVCLNTILAKRRNESRRPKYVEMEEEQTLASSVIPFSDDHLQQLHFLIKQLSDLDNAITLLHLEGYAHREIAEILDLTPTNVSTRFNRIKIKLKKMYERKAYGIE